MADAAGYEPYRWLAVDTDDPEWIFQEGLAITFVHGLSAEEVSQRLSLEVQPLDLTAEADALTFFVGNGKAIFDVEQGWTVLYEDNGLPQETSYRLVEDSAVDKAVLVFSNVNSVFAFGYWQNGARLIGFEFPEDRFGSAPDTLLTAMQSTTGLTMDDYEQAMDDGTYLARLMTLAQSITHVTLEHDFLRRHVLGVLPD